MSLVHFELIKSFLDLFYVFLFLKIIFGFMKSKPSLILKNVFSMSQNNFLLKTFSKWLFY